jgi:eukaryotic-like serine/threonine-protein kinase
VQVSGLKGRYKLGALLGTGGMATVHRATTFGSNARVAVKTLHPHLLHDKSIAKSFRDEARLAQALEHPNIVRVIDVASEEAAAALVMELVDGGSLLTLAYACWNRGDRVPPAVASAIVLDVLAALERAHEGTAAPVIHRDVSPHNVLVGRDGVTKLADFGIARIGDETGSTMTGKVKGKLAYMAPEQFSGRRASERSDIYGAGVILWELLASERLFEGELAELVGKAVNTDRASLSLAKREVPPEVDAIVLRALATDPTERWSAASVMADALQTALPPAGRAEVGAWVEAVAVDVPEGPTSTAEPPPSSRVETTRKPKTAPPPAPKRALAPLIAGAVVLAGAVAWAVTRTTPITPDPSSSSVALEARPPEPSVRAVAPVDSGPEATSELRPTSEPTPTATSKQTADPRAPRVNASASTGELAGFDKRELDRATSAFVNAKIGCQGQMAARVIFRPNGTIEVIGMLSPTSECVVIKMRSLLGTTKPFAGKAEVVDFGFSAAPPPDL